MPLLAFNKVGQINFTSRRPVLRTAIWKAHCPEIASPWRCNVYLYMYYFHQHSENCPPGAAQLCINQGGKDTCHMWYWPSLSLFSFRATVVSNYLLQKIDGPAILAENVKFNI